MRKLILVIEAWVGILKRRNHRKNRQVILKCLNSTCAETSSVAKSIYRKPNWQVDVAGAQKVSVQRVHVSDAIGFNSLCRSNQALRQNLSAVNAAVWHPLRRTLKNVFAIRR